MGDKLGFTISYDIQEAAERTGPDGESSRKIGKAPAEEG
jgi:hypothetical protein